MNSGTLICIWILALRIGIFEYRTLENQVFALVSIRYTITDLQTYKTVKFISRGAQRSDVKNVLSAPQNAKIEHKLKYKNQVGTDVLLSVKSSSMNVYICHFGVSA